MPDDAQSLITIDDFHAMQRGDGPFGQWLGGAVTELSHGRALLRVPVRGEFLREGATVAGPIIMAAADIAAYAAVMTVHPNGAKAVTSDMTMHFLRRPTGEALYAEAAVLRSGKRLIVLDIWVYGEGGRDEPAAHITGSYMAPAP